MVRVETTGDLRVDQIMPVLCSSWAIMLFEECLQDRIGRYKKLKKQDIKATGRIPVVDQGEKFIAGYVDNADDAYQGSLPVIIFGDHTRRIKFIDFSFAVGADGTKILKPIDDLSPKFFYYYLGSLNLESQGYSRHYRFLKQTKIPIPSLAEQRRIVAKLEKLLEKVDACKERLEKIPTILKRFRQSVLAAACSGRLTTDWREKKEPSPLAKETLNGVLNKHSDAGGHKQGNAAAPTEDVHTIEECDFPESWGLAELRDLCEPGRPITYGILKPGPNFINGIPYVRVADFPKDTIELNQIRQTTPEIDAQYTRSRLKRGDILLSIRGTVGRVCVVPSELEGANITQDSARLSMQQGLNITYISIVLRAMPTQMRMQKAVKGVAIRGINIGDVRALQIPFPPLNEQHEIVRCVEALFMIADDIEKRYKEAKAHVDKLTQSILANAFRGDLVPQDPNDEPASELLKRIQEERKKEGPEGRPDRRGSKRRVNTINPAE